MRKSIYLDYQATTPLDPRVFEVMKLFFCEEFGNPGSTTHDYGDRANEAVEVARSQIANLIKAERSSEVYFTSGATESNNIAIQGISKYLLSVGRNHIVTSAIEHKAVLDVVDALVENGFEVTKLLPGSDGRLNMNKLEEAITNKTGLISFMHVNNEIGIINPLQEIGELAKKDGLIFHCDAAQSFGKIPIDVNLLNVDLLSISGHKCYGPKGIGALYIKKSSLPMRMKPIVFGGGQEGGMRSGTLPAPLIAGLGKAAEIASIEMSAESDRVKELRNKLLDDLKKKLPNIIINGSLEGRIPHNLNLSIIGIDSGALINNLRGEIAISNGAACASLAPMPSHVLRAMDLPADRASSAIRIGIGRFTKSEDIDTAIQAIVSASKKLLEMASVD